jgi:hypothetical protein
MEVLRDFGFIQPGTGWMSEMAVSFNEEEELLAASTFRLVLPRHPVAVRCHTASHGGCGEQHAFAALQPSDLRDHIIQGELLQLLLVVTFPQQFLDSVAVEVGSREASTASATSTSGSATTTTTTTTTTETATSSTTSDSSSSSTPVSTEIWKYLQGHFRDTVDLLRSICINVQFAELTRTQRQQLNNNDHGTGASTTTSNDSTSPRFAIHNLSNIKLLDPDLSHKYCTFASDDAAQYQIDAPTAVEQTPPDNNTKGGEGAATTTTSTATTTSTTSEPVMRPAPFIVFDNGSIAYPILVDACMFR